MHGIIILARCAAIAAAGFLLYTIAEGQIATTSATGPDALKVYAMVTGIAVVAAVSSVCFLQRRFVLAGLMITAAFAGELYNLSITADRQILHSEDRQAPVRAHSEAVAAARARIARLEAAEPSTPALAALTKAAEKADADVAVERAKGGCYRECKKLEKVAAAKWAAVTAAAAEAKILQRQDLEAARQDLANMAAPRSATPTADRIGVDAWRYDLVQAGLASLSLNGLAAALLAFGCHLPSAPAGRHSHRQPNRPQIPVASEAEHLAFHASRRMVAGLSEAADNPAINYPGYYPVNGPADDSSGNQSAKSAYLSDIPANFDFADYRERYIRAELPDCPAGKSVDNVVALFTDHPGPDNGGPKGGRRIRDAQREAVLADIRARHDAGERFTSQEQLRQALNAGGRYRPPVTPQRLSEYCAELEAAGELVRRTEGRRKVIG